MGYVVQQRRWLRPEAAVHRHEQSEARKNPGQLILMAVESHGESLGFGVWGLEFI